MENMLQVDIDVGMLRMNNNDPNNNLTSLENQSQEPVQEVKEPKLLYSKTGEHQPHVNRESSSIKKDVENANEEASIIDFAYPKPGCSNVFCEEGLDDFRRNVGDLYDEYYAKDEEIIKKETIKIHSLLPKLSYHLIYMTLLKNYEAENRIELTLWDLLPKERPVINKSSKRKISGVIQNVNDKKVCFNSSDDSYEYAAQHSQKASVYCQQLNIDAELESEEDSFQSADMESSDVEGYSIDTCISCQVKKSDKEKPEIIELDDDITLEDDQSSLRSYPLLKPPTLIVSTGTSTQVHPTIATCSSILAPAKFVYTHAGTNNAQSNAVIDLTKDKPTKSCNLGLSVTDNVKSNQCQADPSTSSDMTVDNVPVIDITMTESRSVASTSGTFKFESILSSASSNATASTATSSTYNEDKQKKTTKMQQKPGKSTNVIKDTVSKNLQEPCSSASTITAGNHGKSTNKIAYLDASTSKVCEADTSTKETCIYLTVDEYFQPVFRTIYTRLMSMFPNKNPAYMRWLCALHIQNNKNMDEDQRLDVLVEHILNSGDAQLPKTNNDSELSAKTNDFEEQYTNLLAIFPDADPDYLKEEIMQIYDKPEEIQEFVQSKLESHDYPTKQTYLEKQRFTEQQKQYSTDFKVEHFLEIFPEPFSHFENAGRKCKFDTDAFEFLKSYYSKHKVCTLRTIYEGCKYNLSLTAKTIESSSPDLKGRRTAYYSMQHLNKENIPFLQETAFIVHKSEIKDYLDKVKLQETEEFKRLKEKNELLECQCCFDNECMPSKCSACDDGHIFCNACIVKGAEAKLGDGDTRIQCFVNCGSEISLSVLQRVLPPAKFSILLQKRQEAEIMAAGLEGLVSCPFCHFASIPPPEDKVFKCLNPECMKESCRLCKQLNHIPLKCDEIRKTEKARLYLEEKMTEALVRNCYRCNRPFFKEEGCNKMSCICGALMCYICDKPINDYLHFSGQGSTRTDLCPLWSDNHRINAEVVRKVAQETTKKLKAKDPNIKLNVDTLLPKLPPATFGPHDEIPHADVIPERAYRLTKSEP